MALLGACNGSSGSTTEDAGSGPTTMTGSSGATTGPGTGSSGEPTSGGSGDPTGSASGTTEVTTGPGTTTGTTEVTGATEATGTGTEGSSGGDTTTGGVVTPCETAEDCQLADSCCSCEVIGPGEAPPACDIQECLISSCAGYGLENAALECRHGVCTFAKLTCNPLGVTCKALPPNCGPGDVPGVLEENDGKCWSGACVPAEACDWVPDCSYCAGDDLVCVLKGQKGAYHVCEPRPLDCGPGEVDCACGQQICDASPPHTVCIDEKDGIQCECPFC